MGVGRIVSVAARLSAAQIADQSEIAQTIVLIKDGGSIRCQHTLDAALCIVHKLDGISGSGCDATICIVDMITAGCDLLDHAPPGIQ